MLPFVHAQRSRFFEQVRRGRHLADTSLLVLTHVLPDRPELLESLARLADIAAVIAIPYSADPASVAELSKKYPVHVPPDLETLRNPEYLLGFIDALKLRKRVIIAEIEGYFAPLLAQFAERWGDRLVGVVEDTEIGHRAYAEACRNTRVPVLSVARSPLKLAEDSLVGKSCLFSCERLMRDAGLILEPCHALVLGYGRVGRGLCQALQRRQFSVSVYDSDPVRNIHAIGDGFFVPEREAALRRANIVFGATGNTALHAADFERLNSGTLLVSCTNKDVEFDLVALRRGFTAEGTRPGIEQFHASGKSLFLLNAGAPINFRDGAVIGPALALTQAEIIAAIAELGTQPFAPGIHDLAAPLRQQLATDWLEIFVDKRQGSYAMSV